MRLEDNKNIRIERVRLRIRENFLDIAQYDLWLTDLMFDTSYCFEINDNSNVKFDKIIMKKENELKILELQKKKMKSEMYIENLEKKIKEIEAEK